MKKKSIKPFINKIYKKDVYVYLPKSIFNCELISNYGNMNIFANLNLIDMKDADKKVKEFCSKNKLSIIYKGINVYTNTRDWYLVPKLKETYYKIHFYTGGLQYGDIFTEVRQRVAAFKYYKEFWNDKCVIEFVDDFLDDAYRFLYKSIEPDFIIFCAKKEEMDPIEYIKSLTKNEIDNNE